MALAEKFATPDMYHVGQELTVYGCTHNGKPVNATVIELTPVYIKLELTTGADAGQQPKFYFLAPAA